MTKFLVLLFLVFMAFQNSFCQYEQAKLIIDDGDRIDTILLDISSYKTYYSTVDLSPWEILKDSGSFNNLQLKDGLWIEYPIDTTVMLSPDNIRTDSIKSEVYNPKLIKLTGRYIEGKKNGNWETFSSWGNNRKFDWILDVETDYENGQKQGKEISFMPWSKDTSMIVIYDKDYPLEVREFDPPNKIKRITKIEPDGCFQYNYDEKGEMIEKQTIK